MPEQQHSVGKLTHLSSAATDRPRMFSPFSCDLGEREENQMMSQNGTKPEHIISQPHIKATTHEPAQLSECVSLQKDNRADSLKGDLIFIPHADSAHYKTGPLFHSGTQGREDKSTLFFTLGAIWHFSS